MYIDYIANNGVLDICKYLNGYLENNYTEPSIPLSEIEWKDVVGYEGYYKVSNTDLYISSGLGESRINFRIFNKPSINFYRINKIETN